MARKTEHQRIRTFIIFRLFIATLLLFLGHFVFKSEMLLFYYIIAALSISSLIFLVWLLYGGFLRTLNWVQVFFDLIVATVLINFTGGVDSMFAPIYVLSIIGVGMVISPASSFVVAVLSSILFSLMASTNLFSFFHFPFDSLSFSFKVSRDPLYVFYATYVRITIFSIVAFLTYYLTGLVLRLEERVKVHERLAFLGQVASNIAHEIRNPLTVISASVETIAGELKPRLSESMTKLMSAVVDESERLKLIFNRVLDYSRVEQMQLKNTSLINLVEQVLFLLHQSRREMSGLRVVKKYPKKDVFVDMDPFQMQEAISNVIHNALDAMPDGGTLTLEMIEKRDTVELIVGDTGVGMNQEILKSLFVPFRTTKKSGTGLGLAQTHKILTEHGGSIEIKSKEEQGTQVRLILRK